MANYAMESVYYKCITMSVISDVPLLLEVAAKILNPVKSSNRGQMEEAP